MPRTSTYLDRESKNGEFSCHIRKNINTLLTIYCKVNHINKTLYVNKVMERDMMSKFNKLSEEEKND